MTTDETIAAIDALPVATPLYFANQTLRPLEVDCGHDYAHCDADDLKQLAAELKLYREFVGAMRVVEGDGWNGNWMSDGKFGIYDADTDNLLATGTDPFDAWRNMRHERES